MPEGISDVTAWMSTSIRFCTSIPELDSPFFSVVVSRVGAVYLARSRVPGR